MLRRPTALGLLVTAVVLGSAVTARPARADLVFTVTLDTSGLVGSSLGPFSLDFQLTDGSGTSDGNNTVILDSFSFGGGGPVGPPFLLGGAWGSVAGTAVLTDSSFLNELMSVAVRK